MPGNWALGTGLNGSPNHAVEESIDLVRRFVHAVIDPPGQERKQGSGEALGHDQPLLRFEALGCRMLGEPSLDAARKVALRQLQEVVNSA